MVLRESNLCWNWANYVKYQATYTGAMWVWLLAIS